MSTCTRDILIVLGIYIFIAFGVYFVLCVIHNSEWDEIDNFGFAMSWPVVVIAGAMAVVFVGIPLVKGVIEDIKWKRHCKKISKQIEERYKVEEAEETEADAE